MSPVYRVIANSWLDVLTNPTYNWPCSTVRTLMARGWVWGTLMPPWAKSRRAREMPRVLRPRSCMAKTDVTSLAVGLLVLPGLLRPWNTKFETFTSAAFLHTMPLTVILEVASATQKS
jgi:hypothetical protein